MMDQNKKRFVLAGRIFLWAAPAVMLILGIKIYIWQRDFSEQINNMMWSSSCAQGIVDYRKKMGKYPATLSAINNCKAQQSADANDYWGHPLIYEARPEGFILVSLGKDNKPDNIDYWKLREINEQDWDKADICGRPNADQIITDLGRPRVCTK